MTPLTPLQAFSAMVVRVEAQLAATPGAGYTPRIRELERQVDDASPYLEGREIAQPTFAQALQALEVGWLTECMRAKRERRTT